MKVYECDNCSAKYSEDDDRIGLDKIKDLLQRIDPGGVVPAGECPDCGALVYVKEVAAN